MRSLLLAAWLVGAALPAGAQPLTVSAASSLADVMADVSRAFQASGGAPFQLNVAGSNFLARQIAEGAPVDVFISADEAQMDVVERRGRLVPGSRRDLLANTLVVIAAPRASPAEDGAAWLASAAVRRVAMANPASVPAGVYGRQWLEGRGVWAQVSPRVVPMLTVRAALAAVRSGHADAGIVFATDARIESRVRVVYAVPAGDAPAIRYPIAAVRGPREAAAARLLQFLAGPESRRLFEAAGFAVLAP
jgi:molybdate transport system substrate-binding protein